MADLIANNPFVEARVYVSEGGLQHASRRKLRFTKTREGRIRLPMVGTHARGASLEIEPDELRQIVDLLYPKPKDVEGAA